MIEGNLRRDCVPLPPTGATTQSSLRNVYVVTLFWRIGLRGAHLKGPIAR